MLKIYIDLLVLTNMILTMIYIETLSLFVHRKIYAKRMFLSSLTGGLFSLILIPDGITYTQAVIITLVKISGIIVTVFIAYKYSGIRQFLTYLLIYAAIRLVYLGLTLVLWEFSQTKIIYVKNFTFYFDISLTKLTACVIGAYILLNVYEFVARRICDKSSCYTAIYKCGNYEIKLPAQSDSGNKLCDSFTGEPVVIFYSKDMYMHFFPDGTVENLQGFHLVPFSTINGEGLIPVTARGEVKIINHKGKETILRCCVGVVNSNGKNSRAVFPACLVYK